MFQKRIDKPLKPKLPRKRKKAMIKAQGRKSYMDTVHLAKVTEESPCKFWVNRSVYMMPTMHEGQLLAVPTPTQFW